MYWIGEIAHQMALIPLAWLAWLRLRGQSRDRAYWVLGLAFAVSWFADLAADLLSPSNRWVASLGYPLTQAAIIGAVFLTRRDALIFATCLLAAGVGSVLWRGTKTPDMLLHSVAWLGVLGIIADRWSLGPLRIALGVYFGFGWLAWLAYNMTPGWTTWSVYQCARLVGLLLFCRAISKPEPTLRLA